VRVRLHWSWASYCDINYPSWLTDILQIHFDRISKALKKVAKKTLKMSFPMSVPVETQNFQIMPNTLPFTSFVHQLYAIQPGFYNFQKPWLLINKVLQYVQLCSIIPCIIASWGLVLLAILHVIFFCTVQTSILFILNIILIAQTSGVTGGCQGVQWRGAPNFRGPQQKWP
jgi:hypothetical protein